MLDFSPPFFYFVCYFIVILLCELLKSLIIKTDFWIPPESVTSKLVSFQDLKMQSVSWEK